MLYLKEAFDLCPVLLPFSVISAPPNGFPFTNVDTLTTTSFGLLGTTFGITTGRAGPPGILPPPNVPSLSASPANASSLSLRLNESSLVNTPPPNSPALLPLGSDCNLSNPI